MNETKIPVLPDRAEKKLIRNYYNKGAAAAAIFVFLYFVIQSVTSFFDLSSVNRTLIEIINLLLTATLEIAAIAGGCYFTGQKFGDFFKNREGYNTGTVIKTYVTTQGLGYLGIFLGLIFVVIITLLGGKVDIPTQTQGLPPGASAVVTVHAVIIAPILEEILCRGVILGGIKKYNQTLALIVSSLTFGLIHGNAFQFAYATVMGLVLGTIALKCKSVIPTIFAHAGVNMTALCLQLVSKLTGMDKLDITQIDWKDPQSLIAFQRSIPQSFIIFSNLFSLFLFGMIIAAIIIAALHIKKFRTYCKKATTLGKTRGFPIFITSPLWIIVLLFLFCEVFVFPFVA
ncbi:MAG: CPBP family intramembrane metalloprotease [Ruminococcus sp.]|jgi:membrane protease YdiL (CAAX protease family)|nr:CPBP family intramembrane metalloprotease [Ruminococcus sp.]